MANYLEHIPSLYEGEYLHNKMLVFGTALKTIFQFGRAKARVITQNWFAIVAHAKTNNMILTISSGNITLQLSSLYCWNLLRFRDKIENFANGMPLDNIITRPRDPSSSDIFERKKQLECQRNGTEYKSWPEREIESEGRQIYSKNYVPFDWAAYKQYYAQRNVTLPAEYENL